MAGACFRKVLCPIDFSKESDAAMGLCDFLRRELGAEVSVVHAERFEAPLEFTSAQVEGLVKEMKMLQKHAQDHLKNYTEAKFPSLSASFRVIDTPPADAILSAAEDLAADLIVMGTTGKSGIRRFSMGSVAESVTREAKVPVLTVRGTAVNTAEKQPLNRILVPVNYTEHARETLQTASCLARSLGSSLLVTHIVESGEYDENTARENLCRWVPSELDGTCSYDAAVRSGNAAEQIVQMAADERADLIVIAAVHRPFLESTIIGSTSERVMRHAPCPVMMIPARALPG